jgi:hypothetical protein
MVAHPVVGRVRFDAYTNEVDALALHPSMVRYLVSRSKALGKSCDVCYLAKFVCNCNRPLVSGTGSSDRRTSGGDGN